MNIIKKIKQIFIPDVCVFSKIHITELLSEEKLKKRKESIKRIKNSQKKLKLQINKTRKFAQGLHKKSTNKECIMAIYMLEKMVTYAKSMLILSKNNQHEEAFMLSGIMVEGLASVKYAIKNKLGKDYLNFKKFQMARDFYFNRIHLGTQNSKTENAALKTLSQYGKNFVKSNKNHNEAISFIKDNNNSYENKYLKILETYHQYWFKTTINQMMKHIKLLGILKIIYDQYCSTKHFNRYDIFYCPECKKHSVMPLPAIITGQALDIAIIILCILEIDIKFMTNVKKLRNTKSYREWKRDLIFCNDFNMTHEE